MSKRQNPGQVQHFCFFLLSAMASWQKQLTILKQAQHKLSLSGKQVVVVGGTSGIGQAMAIRLAQANANVTIIGRNKKVGHEIVEQMKKASLSIPEIVKRNSSSSSVTIPSDKFSFVECDATLLSNVVKTSNLLKDIHSKIDYLICTQGIASMKGRTETIEGLDEKMVLHYYSRYGFAYYLSDLLQKSVDPRFISVFSAGVHKPYGQFHLDTDLKKNFTLNNCVKATGMYNDFAVDALSQKFPSISFIHIAPGFISTGWGKELPSILKPLVNFAKRWARSKEDCAEFMCQTIFNPNFKAPGYYLLDQYGQSTTKTELHLPENIQFVWNYTEECLRKNR
jgi:NAD(P)-dependent dehydrogenase (short-subunit alcohol dehydrogenase family)